MTSSAKVTITTFKQPDEREYSVNVGVLRFKWYTSGVGNFSLACDETADVTNTAQLATFVRGITGDFEMKEELLSL